MVGVDAKNKNILHMKFICPLCSLIIRDPVQLTGCDQRRCQSCFDTQHGMIMKCLRCPTGISQRQIMTDRGFANEMKILPIECTFCDWSDILVNYSDHLMQLHSAPKCEHCDEQYNSFDKFFEHKAFQYQKITVECLLKNFGCSAHVCRDNILDHYLSEQHQNLFYKVILQIKQQLENRTITSFEIDADLARSTTVMVVDPDTENFQEVLKTINNWMDVAQMRNEDETCLNSKLLEYQMNSPTVTADFFQVQPAVQECFRVSNQLTSNQDVIQHGLTSLNDDENCLLYDGIFVWRISNVKEKRIDAQFERQTSIDSPPFYTSLAGYKMCVRVYLYGNGEARSTHMSLFCVLMQGKNDEFLRFPFNHKVAFCLHNQLKAEDHIIDSFRPDTISNSFERPRSDMNIASGIPKFVSLSIIQPEENPYVRDDTMFIKVMVDMDDTPKPLLRYIFSLNPGIPSHVRQILIRGEWQRRAQQ